MGSGLDPGYVSLLGLADSFLRCGKQGVAPALKCLNAIFSLSPSVPLIIQARTHLQLGSLIKKETTNKDLAKQHFERAWYLSQDSPQLLDVLFETGSNLADIYCQEGRLLEAKQALIKAFELSATHPYWQCRLAFQISSILSSEKDYDSAINYLNIGEDAAYHAGAFYTRMLFFLTKAMLFLLERKFSDANPILHQSGPLIESWTERNTHQTESVAKQQKEYLQIFYLVLQVWYYLMVGQVKSVKSALKQLQQSITTLTTSAWPAEEEMISSNTADNFQWLSSDYLVVLAYLVTAAHSTLAGYMDKAQKYTDKALAQIDKIPPTSNDRRKFPPSMLSSFHVILLEHVIQCRIVSGNKSRAIKELGNLCCLLEKCPLLLQRHRAQLHTLLGLYAMSMNCMEAAESQLNAALRTSQERELWTFANLNLGIVYLRSQREGDFGMLLDRIHPERLPSQSHTLQAAAYYIQGLHAFFGSKFNDSKRFLRETLKLANAEDLNRLTSCALVLLAQIFLCLNNHRESMNMVMPALQLGSKIPDPNVQMWASSILRDLYRVVGDNREQEAYQSYTNFHQVSMDEHVKASKQAEHILINWTDGPFPIIPQISAPIL